TLAVAALDTDSCLVDGELISCDQDGLAVFELLRKGKASAGRIFAPPTVVMNSRRFMHSASLQRIYVYALINCNRKLTRPTPIARAGFVRGADPVLWRKRHKLFGKRFLPIGRRSLAVPALFLICIKARSSGKPALCGKCTCVGVIGFGQASGSRN